VPFDESFRLDVETRARVAPQFDLDALERLLQHLDAPGRGLVLDEFLLPQYRTNAPGRNEWRILKGFTDPVLNELLAEVWQPFWDTQPDEMLTVPHSQYPGQELARRRRRAQS
jgi:hypothetical protein